MLVVATIIDFGYMPVAREKYKKAIGRRIIETGKAFVVTIVYNVGLPFTVRHTRHMINNAEALNAAHHILEIDVVIVAL